MSVLGLLKRTLAFCDEDSDNRFLETITLCSAEVFHGVWFEHLQGSVM